MPTIRDTLLHSYRLHGADLYRESDYGSGVEPLYRDEDESLATHVAIPSTGWGDYCGDDVTRSNHRSMLRDLTDLVTDYTGMYSYSVLVIALDVEVDDLYLEWLSNLLDYPVWDESDWSDMTMELEAEAFADWGRDDLKREAVRLADKALASVEDVERVEDYLDDLSTEELTRLCSEAAYSLGDHPHYIVETGGSGYWEGFDAWADALLRQVFEVMDREDIPAEWQPVPVCEGQRVLVEV